MLPSDQAAHAIVRGQLAEGVPAALFWTGVRAAAIAAGLAVAGERGSLVRKSIYGALGVEVFVLVWAWWNKEKT